MKLYVYLRNRKCGYLFSTPDKGIAFEYDMDYLSDTKNHPLSVSLPTSKKTFSQKECIPYFYGLLPEGDVKKKIAAELHVSETSTLKLLEALGGECAGTVSLFKEEEIIPPQDEYLFCEKNYLPIKEEEIFQKIKNSSKIPVLMSEKEYRLSLAGAQEKIALTYINGNWYVPLNGAPSTHILKPARLDYPGLGVNEYISMKLAKHYLENVPEVNLLSFSKANETYQVFCIERYDRKIVTDDNSIRIQRVHQEDFCQALGIMSDNKYQNDGGPGLTDLISIIRDNSSSPIVDVRKCAEYFIFNFLIGNCDAHGKNYSLLYKDGIQLAPAYDIVSTTVYPDLSKKLSMKIGHYEIEKVTRAHIIDMFEKAGINARIVNRIFDNFVQKTENLDDMLKNDSVITEHSELANQIVNSFKTKLCNM